MRLCETCEYWVKSDLSDTYVCCNPISDYYLNFTNASSGCMEYEEKEVLEKDRIIEMMKECMCEMNRLIRKFEEV